MSVGVSNSLDPDHFVGPDLGPDCLQRFQQMTLHIVAKELSLPRGCLQFVIVVFPDHTHLLFLIHVIPCLDNEFVPIKDQSKLGRQHLDHTSTNLTWTTSTPRTRTDPSTV